jgi:transcriptional regulator with XRE-family HTH domain
MFCATYWNGKQLVFLGEKIALLRSLEGNLRGLKRPLSKSELARLIREELDESISQAYLSQLEAGKRPHMTEKTRELLARFFKVHPGYLVSDPPGFRTQLAVVDMPAEARFDEWVASAAAAFRNTDSELAAALDALARHPRTRELLLLTAKFAESPGMVGQIRAALAPVRSRTKKDETPRSREGGKR